MAAIGMIFQLDTEDDSGQIMFAQGEKRSFVMDEWVDSENMPGIGQKVSFDYHDSKAQIKLAGEEAQITQAPNKPKQSPSKDETSSVAWLDSIDDYIDYFKDLGFNKAKDIENGSERNLSFRKLENGDPVEVVVTQIGSDITVVKTVNGKPTPL